MCRLHFDWCPGQVLCFPRPAEVPGAAHGPPEHGGLHWPDSGGLAYEVGGLGLGTGCWLPPVSACFTFLGIATRQQVRIPSSLIE